MNHKFTEEQQELVDAVINFAKTELNDKDSSGSFSYEIWNKISEFGVLGLPVPQEYGGMGESYLTAALILEAFGYACTDNGLIFVINNHIWVSENLINLYGSKIIKKKYLPQMTCGKKIGAIAITEAEAGSDALAMKTKAESKENYFILNGSKMFISNGPIADIFVVFAKTQRNGKDGITAFLVEKEYEGVIIGKEIEKMGLESCPTSEIFFKDVKVPCDNIIGKINQGSLILTMALEWERIFEFAPHIGAMRRIMERCIDHINNRKQFGKQLSTYQALTHKISDMEINIYLSKMMLYHLAEIKDLNKSTFKEASIFKVFVSESYIKTCRDAMQIFGAYGYTKEYGIEQELRDALACSIYSGTNEIQRNTIFTMIDNRIGLR